MKNLGLDENGFIINKGNLANIHAPFDKLLNEVKQALVSTFPADIHSIYIYGSIVKGNPRLGASDMDILICYKTNPTEAIKRNLDQLSKVLSEKNRIIVREVGITTTYYDEVKDPANFSGWGSFLKSLCICVYGEDLTKGFPAFKPSAEVAIGLNGEIADEVKKSLDTLSISATEDDIRKISSTTSRKFLRTGFCMVMARSTSWTSDRKLMYEYFITYFPEKKDEMHHALIWSENPSSNKQEVQKYITEFGVWLAENFMKEAKVV